MRTTFKLLRPILDLFDGGEGGGDGAVVSPGGTQADTPASTRRGASGEFANVVFGKQAENTEAQQEASDAGEPESLEDRRQRYRELVNSEEFKEFYTEDTQRIINQRFKETQGLQEQLDAVSPVIDLLRQKYGVGDGNMDVLMDALDADSGFWEQAAEEAGMSVEQYKEFQRLERELGEAKEVLRRQQGQRQANAQMQRWYTEGEQTKQTYPHFDLQREVQDPQTGQAFQSLLRSGVPVQTAFEVIHMDEIKAGVAKSTAKAAEQQITSNIRARGQRPAEAGTTAQASFTVKDDVSKLTKKERAEIARRVAKGEQISF